ncbi:hypothetical protein ACWCPQ_14640 [Nocardia sp. NPDC001965]
MAGPGGKEVGRISVKVVPDTDGFRRKLKQDLEAETNGLEVEVGIDLEPGAVRELSRDARDAARAAEAATDDIETGMDLDVSGFLADVEMALQAAERALANIDSQIDVDQAEFLAGIEVMADTAAAMLDRIDAGFNVNEGEFLAKIQAMAQAAEYAVQNLDVELTPQAAGFVEAVRGLVEYAEQAAGDIEIDVEANTAGLVAEVSAAAAAADAAAGEIEIDVDVNDNASRTANRISDRFRSMASSVTSSIGNMTSGLGRFAMRFTREIALVLAVAALIPPVLALATGAILGLPALLAGAGIAAGAVALGFDGMKEAASVLKDELDSLKQVMNDVTKIEFTPQFERLESVFPMLERAMPKVTSGLADFFGGFVDAVTSDAGMANIENTIENVGSALSTAAAGARDLTEGVLNMVSKVSDKFPGLANFFNSYAERFENWINSITTPGVDGESALERMLSNSKNILESLFDLFGRLVDKGGELLADEEFTEKMADFVDGFGDFIENTLPAMKSMFEDVADLVSGISDTWSQIEWVINPTGKATDEIGMENDDNTFLPNIMKFGALGTFETLIRGFDDFKEKGALAFQITGQRFADYVIAPIYSFLMIGLPQYIDNIKTWFSEAFTSIGNWAKENLNPMNWFSGVEIDWSWLTNGATGAMFDMRSIFSLGFSDLGTIFSGLRTTFGAALGSLGSIASTAMGQVVSAIGNAGTQMVAELVSAGASLIAEAASWGGKIASAAGSMGTVLVAAGKALMTGLLDGIKQGLADVLSFAAGIASKIAAVKGPLPKDRKELIPQGEALMEGLGTGIESGFAPILDRVKDMASQLAGSFDSAVKPIGSPIDTKQLEEDMQRQSDMIDLQTDLLDLQAQRLEQKAKFTPDKDEKKRLQEQASALRDQADVLNLEQKAREFELEWDVQLDSEFNIVPKVDTEAQGLTVMEKLQRGLEKGWVGVSNAVRDMVDELGEAFGAEDLSGQLEEIGKSSGFNDIPKDFITSTGMQFMSDLGAGGGALTAAATEGSTYIFNVATADEAEAVSNRKKNRERLGRTRR